MANLHEKPRQPRLLRERVDGCSDLARLLRVRDAVDEPAQWNGRQGCGINTRHAASQPGPRAQRPSRYLMSAMEYCMRRSVSETPASAGALPASSK